jgi:hypothetical protein
VYLVEVGGHAGDRRLVEADQQVAAVAGVAVGRQRRVRHVVDVAAGDHRLAPGCAGRDEVVSAGHDVDPARADEVPVGGVDVDADPAVPAVAGAAKQVDHRAVAPVVGGQWQVGGVVAVGPGGAVPAGRVAPGVGFGGLGGAALAVPERHAVGGEPVQHGGAGPDQRRPARGGRRGLGAGDAVGEAGHGVFGQG